MKMRDGKMLVSPVIRETGESSFYMTMKVLVIDDEEDNRQIANLALTMIGGFTVIEAENGEVGLNMAITEKPDVILLDFVMPVMNGLETLKALRVNPVTEKIPVIFVSTKSLQEREKNSSTLALRAFCRSHLTQPNCRKK